MVDTAGMRKKSRVRDFVEKQSTLKSMQAIRSSDVVILVLDAEQNLNKQDLILAKRAIDYGKSVVISLNKWDLITDKIKLKNDLHNKIKISLSQLKDIKILPTSSINLYGIDKLLLEIKHVFKISQKRIPTSDLNQWFKFVLEKHPPPLFKGKKNALKYISQVNVSPPHFIIFCSHPDEISSTYIKYIQNSLKAAFDFSGVNIKINLKKTGNPFITRK